jgi:putative hydrolase of HD superfamily
LLEDFFKIIINLKNVQRKGWMQKLEIKNPESVADHSFSMALMAMILSELQKLDTKKILEMTLLHDLVESVVGDFTPEEISKPKKLQLENTAMEKILHILPENIIEVYQKIWNEFQLGSSEEAIFVHEMDKLEMVFQAKNYVDKGFPKEKIQPFLDTANTEIKNKHLREIMSNLF